LVKNVILRFSQNVLVKMIPVRLIATGKALPSQKVTAEALDRMLNKPSGYVYQKGGVRERHFASATQSQSQLGAAALRDALQRAHLKASDIDLLIGACGVSQQALPSTACLIAAEAGMSAGAAAFDVNASCLSFLVAFRLAASLLASSAYKRIAVVSCDLPSRGLDWDDPEASLIFGDGAAAVILEPGQGPQGIGAFHFETYPQGSAFCEIRAGGSQCNPRMGAVPEDYLFRMDGRAVFKMATQVIPGFLKKLMLGVEGGVDSVDLVVPHQASHLGMAHAARKLKLSESRIVNIYETHGNQVAASIPTALHEAVSKGRAGPGSRLLLMGTAAGLSVGGLVLDL
jgi:3-oxoacyl-[acyl-carrier-protein] synthase-3